MRGPIAAAVLALLGLASCASPERYDYTAYVEYMPRSILVLPPLDETPETAACYGCLATVSRPIAEAGYYVFPVAVVDRMMRENGLPTSYEMHAVPLEKLREIFDPDAVLYLKVTDWGTSYQVLSSATTVSIQGNLVDARTGTQIWAGSATAVEGSGDAGGGIAGMLASALVKQVASSFSDPSQQLSQQASWSMFGDTQRGLLLGSRHPEHEKSLAQATAKKE